MTDSKPWKAMLDRYTATIKEVANNQKGALRFDRPCVAVHEVAEQYYCEKKVELNQIYGKEMTPEKRLGAEAHELLLKDSVKVKLEELWSQIFSDKLVSAREMRLAANHKGNVIIGITDKVVFSKTLPILLLEHKFSAHLRPFHDHHVQARLYCYLLKLMGFDTSKLKYAIVIAKPESRQDEELRKAALHILKHPQNDIIDIPLRSGMAKAYVNWFDAVEAEGELDWALEYWTKKRNAKPTKFAGKCRVCQHNQTCEFTLDKTGLVKFE